MYKETYLLKNGRYFLSSPQIGMQNIEREMINTKMSKLNLLSNTIRAPMRKCRRFLKILGIIVAVLFIVILAMMAIHHFRHRRDYQKNYKHYFENAKLQKIEDHPKIQDFHDPKNLYNNETVPNGNENSKKNFNQRHEWDHHGHHHDRRHHHHKSRSWFNCTITKFNETNHDTSLDCELKKIEKEHKWEIKDPNLNIPTNSTTPFPVAPNEPVEVPKVQKSEIPATNSESDNAPVESPKNNEKPDLVENKIPFNNLTKGKHHPDFPFWVVINNQKFLMISAKRVRKWRQRHGRNRWHHKICPFFILLKVFNLLLIAFLIGLIMRCCKKKKLQRVLRRKLNRFITLENMDRSGVYITYVNNEHIDVEIREGNEQLDMTQMQIQTRINQPQNINVPSQNINLAPQNMNLSQQLNTRGDRQFYNIEDTRQNESLMSGRRNFTNFRN
jgi:hypothetical protein